MDVRIDLLLESCGNAECYKADAVVHPALKASATGYRGVHGCCYGVESG